MVVIYESLTGNTRRAAELIARELTARGTVAVACPITRIDYQALSEADTVVIGSWVDGIFVVGQRPGRAARIVGMPSLSGKRCVVFCTYAINPGKVLDKMTAIVQERGGEVIGGMTIRRTRIAEGVHTLVDRLLNNVAA